MDKRLENFKNFLYLCWKFLNLPEPTPIQYDIADYLQSKERRLVIEAFRGVGKSWITSAFVCHQLLLNPQRNILVVSASKNRADDFSTFTQRLINEMPILQHLIPRDNQRHSKIISNVTDKEGQPTDPQRFDDVDLLERLSSYGRSGFNLQFMLDTTMSDSNRYPLKLNDLIVASGCTTWDKAPAQIQWASGTQQIKGIDPDIPNVGLKGDYYVAPLHLSDEYAPFEGVAMSIDPAGRGEDKTAYAVLKMLHGVLYLTDIGALDGGYSDSTLEELSSIAKRNKVNNVVIESNFGDGMATALLKPVMAKIHPCQIEEVRHNIQKEKRIIDTLEPIMNTHRLVVDEHTIKEDFKLEPNHQLFRQLTRITRDKGALRHDDQIDALAIAANYWVERMDRDQTLSYQQHKDELINKDLEKFMEHTVGRQPKRERWI